MSNREEDPGIAWIRRVRHEISAEFGHDPKKMGDHYRELEKKYADRLEPVTKAGKPEPAEIVTKR